ncbi:MAG TPA: hypothetical protein HA362_02600 [Nanoarchaeota archaeon]|nr:hypothetical protein [Nanoarchaeota archaeon]
MKLLLVCVLLLAILPSFAFAQNETGLPEGYRQITGEAGTTVFNPGLMQEIFGAAAEESGGAVLIKYRHGESGEGTSLGYLFGTISAAGGAGSKLLKVANGGFISPETSNVKVNITGREILVDASSLPNLEFAFSGGIYTRHNYSFACKSACGMKAVVKPQFSFLNITGEGIVGRTEIIKGLAGNGESNATTITADFSMINLFNTGILSFSAVPTGRGMFGSVSVESERQIVLMQLNPMPGFFIENIQAKEAKVYVSETSNAGFIPESVPGPASIKVFNNAGEMLELKSGRLMMLAEEEDYLQCAEMAAAPLEALGYYRRGSCITFQDLLVRIKPRNNTILAESGQVGVPLMLMLKMQHSDYKIQKLDIEAFDKNDDTSRIIVQRPVRRAVLAFSRSNVTAENGKWQDLGISFEAEVYQQDEYEPDEGQYNHFECDLRKNECFLDYQLVSGFFAQTLPARCDNDAECGAGRKCTTGQCIRLATCRKVESASSAAESDNAIDVLFIGDGYDNWEQFTSDIEGAVDLNGAKGTKGLMSVKPFSDSAGKFIFWAMLEPEKEMPADVTSSGLGPSADYANRLSLQCGKSDKTIVLSNNRRYVPHAQPFGVAVLSMPFTAGQQYWALGIVHEFGHAFGGLYDEYYEATPGGELRPTLGRGIAGDPNCLRYPDALEKWKKLLGEAEGTALADEARHSRPAWYGCGGYCDDRECRGRLRPSFNSIMRHQWAMNEQGWDTFNPIDTKVLQNKIDEATRQTER